MENGLHMTELKVYAAFAVATGLSGLVASMQTLLVPDNTWLPIGAVIGLVSAAIYSTIKVVRMIDRIHGALDRADRERKMLAKKLDVDLEDE